ncbi:MAG: PAS domain-containing sensor histidine kinase [Candidatus Promineifilaceae bacterium]|jgi:PAS domain S-box-containing protein
MSFMGSLAVISDNEFKEDADQLRKTDKRLALEMDQLNVMVEAALVGIYVIQDDLFRFVNPAMAHMFDYQPDELVDKVNVLDLIHPEDREGVAMRIRQRFAGQVTMIPHVARGITRNGEIIHFESLARPVTYKGRPAISGTLVNVTKCVCAQENIEKHRRQLQRLSAQLIAAREAESKRISQELHDVIGQSLTAVSINLAQIKQDLSADEPAAVWGRLAESEILISQTLAETRKLALELRPTMLDDLGLIPTLRWYIHQFEKRLNIPVAFTSAGKISQPLSPELETVIYRVVQEGLTNVARHARAGEVAIKLNYQPDRTLLIISDDGVGFDAKQLYQSKNIDDHLGLLGIGERIAPFAGVLHVDSSLGKGTTLKVTFPNMESPVN